MVVKKKPLPDDEPVFGSYDDGERMIPGERQPENYTAREWIGAERLQREMDRIAEIEDLDERKAESAKLHEVMGGR